MRVNSMVAAISFFIILLITNSSWAATIYGTVTDICSSAPFSNTSVSVSVDGGHPMFIQTDSNGNYTIQNVPAGTYNITMSVSGYQSLTKRISVRIGDVHADYALRRINWPSATTGVAQAMASAATLTGTANPNGFSTVCRFQYGSTTSYGMNSGSKSIGSGTTDVNVNIPISGLVPGSTYHYRLEVQSTEGTCYGIDRSFTTETVSPTVHTGAASMTNSSNSTFTATLSGTVNPNGVATWYYFQYGQTTAYGSYSNTFYAGLGTSTLTVSANVSGDVYLSPDHFRIVAYNDFETGYGADAKIPDAFEPNNIWQEATDHDSLLVYEMINNFHTSNDIDWIKVDLTNTTNEHDLQFYDVGANTDIAISVYVYENGQLNLIGEVNSNGVGQNEIVHISPPINGPVYLEVTTLAFGNETEYKFQNMAMICDVGFLTGTVTDSFNGDPITGVTIHAEENPDGFVYNVVTLPDGTYFQVACVGDYDITVSAPGYNTFSGSTNIPSPLATTVYDILLSSPNSPPSADAGPDQEDILEGDTVMLDGSGSGDTDDGIDTYSWVQIGEPTVLLSDPNSINPSFEAPQVGLSGLTLTFQLTVTDYFGYSDVDTVDISVSNIADPGDIDGDGDIQLTDAILALQAASGISPGSVHITADVNGDEKIAIEEAIYILQKMALLRE